MTQETFELAEELVTDIKQKKKVIGNLSEMIGHAENEKDMGYVLSVEYKSGQCLDGYTIYYYLMPELLPALKLARERMKRELQELERQLEEL